MTKPIQVNLFEQQTTYTDSSPQVISDEELTHIQDRIKWAFSEAEFIKEHLKIINDPNYKPLSFEEWEKDHDEKYGFHDFMMKHFSSLPSNK